MTTLSRQQRGLRLSDETWTGIRIAAVSTGVSASSLVEALGSEWIVAHHRAEKWAEDVLERSKAIQQDMNQSKRAKKAANAQISSDIALDAE
jgi:hypothetical protein